jgi:hypothetical protein
LKIKNAARKGNTSVSKRLWTLDKWHDVKATTSQRKFAKDEDINESTLRKWIREEAKIRSAHHESDIYIHSSRSTSCEWVKGEIKSKGESPSIAEVERYIMDSCVDEIEGHTYDSRRRIVERTIKRAKRDVQGFASITANVESHLMSSIEELTCGCKTRCGGGCKNRRRMRECVGDGCAVGENCGNRRIQQGQKGEKPPLRRLNVTGKGYGMFAINPIRKGQFIEEYVGCIIPDSEREAREKAGRGAYMMELDDGVVIDAIHDGNNSRNVNHSCKPNCVAEIWYVGGKARVGFFAKKSIKRKEEITMNYGREYDWHVDCLCDSCVKKQSQEK